MARDWIRCCFWILLLHLTVFYGRNYSLQNEKIVKEGDVLVWNCSLTDGGPLVWKHNNHWVTDSWILPNGSLFIAPVVKDLHEGQYRCCIRKTRPQNCGEPQDLIIGSSIALSICPRGVFVEEGEPWRWTCSVNNTENAEIRWQRNGQWLENSRPLTFANGSLYFQSVRDSDEGLYRCCATNSVGTFCSKKAKIDISKLPLLSVQPQKLEAKVGTATRIRCHLSGTSPRQVLYSWLHNGSNFLPENTSRVSILPQGIIQFTRILEEDAGVYQCFDANSPKTAANATLEVIASDLAISTEHIPLLNTAPSSQEKAVSESALLECLPQREDFTVVWTWNGGPVNSNAMIAGRHNLYFENLQVEDSGIYTCNVTDETTGRSAQASASLLVQEPPVITYPLETVTAAKLAFLIILRCPTGETHPPHYTWLFNGEPLSPGRRVVIGADMLRIRNPTGTDAGVYQCFVSNVAGEDVSSTEVRFRDGAPRPPQNVTVASVTSKSFFVRWSMVTEAMGYSVYYYKWPDGDDEEIPTNLNSMNVIRGVTPFTKYAIFVVAFNIKSGSNHSNLVFAETAEAKPLASPFMFLSVTPSLSVNISWLPLVKELRQGTIIKYLLEYTLKDSDSVVQVDIPANVSHYEVTGLQRGEQYSFRTAAATSVGSGVFSEWRNVLVEVGAALPRPVPQVEISNGTSVSIVWKQPPRNVTVDGHWLAVTNLQHEPVGSVRKICTPVLKAVWSNLEPDTSYEIHIAAFNQHGDGPRYLLNFMTQSTVPILTKCPVLPPFSLYSSSVTSTSLILNWSDPVTNLDYSQFRIEYHPSLVTDSDPSVLVILDPKVRQQEFTDLQPYTTYSFRVSVGCNGGVGEFSVSHQITTLEDVPATPPAGVEAHPVDPHKVSVYWLPPIQPNGIIIYYVVLYSTNQEDMEPNWRVHRSQGTTQYSVIDHLDSGTRYFFKVRAGTQVGEGPLTDAVPALTMQEEGGDKETTLITNKQLGVLIGVFLALLCIILCSSLIIYKYRCVDTRTRHSGGTPFSIRPNGMVHPKCSCSGTQGEDSFSILHSPCNRGSNGHIRTTFRNSGHYVIDYPENCSTQLLSHSQETSQSSTSMQSPPLDTGQESSLPNWSKAVVLSNGSQRSTMSPPPAQSEHCSQTALLEEKNSSEGSNHRYCPKDESASGETCSLLPQPLPLNSDSRNAKETVV